MESGLELRRARAFAGVTQAELAARAGTSQATVSSYESGTKAPSMRTFERLMAAAGARVRVEHGHQPLRQPTRRDEERVARTLADVLALAEALPTRHESELRYPRLGK